MRLDTFAGGFLTSVAVGLFGYVVIATTDLANDAWSWWALLGTLVVAAGIFFEVRFGARTPLFGAGLAVGALISFGALFLVVTALEIEIGL